MINPKTILAEWVTALQTLPNLVDALGGDGGRIQFYTENATVFGQPTQNNIRLAILSMPPGSIMIAWQGSGPARLGNALVFAHDFSLYLRAPEVADVLTRKGVTGKLVMGMDSDQRTIEGIQSGTITATLGQKPFTMGFLSVKMLDDLHHHPPASLLDDFARDAFSPLPTFVDTGVSLIDKTNVAAFVETAKAAQRK